MEIVGATVSSFVFAIIQFGVIISQVVLFERYRTQAMKRFIMVTSMFLTMNIAMLILSTGKVNWSGFNSFVVLNAISIALYLFFLTVDSMLPNTKTIQRIPWLVVSIAIGFGTYALAMSLPMGFENFEEKLFIFIPILLSIQLLTLVLKLGKSTIQYIYIWLGLLFTGVLVFGSFLFYFQEIAWTGYIFLNLIFLIFTASQYWVIIHNSRFVISPKPIEADQRLEGFGFSPTEKKIAKMLLEGMSYEEIAENRNRSYSSVTSQSSNLFKKVGVHSREEFIDELTKN